MMLKNSKVIIFVILLVVLIIVGNELVRSAKDPYDRWVNQLTSSSIAVVSIALSSAMDLEDPRTVVLLQKAWLDDQSVFHVSVNELPLIKLELANVLFFLTDGNDEEYFAFIVNQLDNKSSSVSSYATQLLALNPQDSTVNILKNIIMNKGSHNRGVAIKTLGSIALRNPYALNLMHMMTKSEEIKGTALEPILWRELEEVYRINGELELR